jgi:hypothetical protein
MYNIIGGIVLPSFIAASRLVSRLSTIDRGDSMVTSPAASGGSSKIWELQFTMTIA